MDEDNKAKKPDSSNPDQERESDPDISTHLPAIPDAVRRNQSSGGWTQPSGANPDLYPSLGQSRPIDLREPNPLEPRGMLFDPRQLIEGQRRESRPDPIYPPGARFDPYGPPDPSQVFPGRGPDMSTQYAVPDPDHMLPPGQPRPQLGGKSLKFPPGPPFSRHLGGGRGGGPPFL